MSNRLPEAFVERMKNLLGTEFDQFSETLKSDAPVSVRLNSRKKLTELFDDLKTDKVKWHSEAFFLKERPVFTLDPAFHAGAYYVQEASSMFLKEALVQTVDFSKPLRVLDLCAAPGGKTTLMADLMNSESLLVANEVIKSRVSILKENLLKWGFPNVIVSNHDAEEFADLEGFFDLVLVDAPCSGEGLFRKDKNASSHWSEEAVATCSARQKRILQAAAMAVAPDGVLIYSTCTYNPEENHQNVQWFVKNQDFEVLTLNTSTFPEIESREPGYQFYPHRLIGEGFYIAALQKKGGDTDYTTAKIRLNRLPKKQVEELTSWLERPEHFEFFLKKDDGIVAVPKELASDFGTVLKGLFRRSSGFEIGTFKKNNFVPSHALALSSEISLKVPKIDLSKDEALLFLKKESFDFGSAENGWHLITYQGLGLGWAKVIGNRVNNYLPKEWRIRMDIE
ncbi:RsmB/NOP family class I SAM-dependent RNA methyltransferase [Jiulongibacter sediminis]|uniref:RsmB/NOP family class I SAM-dependent RNA methyltransferase n=1 Tax=Jiulongibacter sediminis TaxID=1605367 RepID=UPI0026EE1C75|nr:RsmB/NOP family class I SAM-dependent RNA methyltransferase [Jiulongibacter sediminis]